MVGYEHDDVSRARCRGRDEGSSSTPSHRSVIVTSAAYRSRMRRDHGLAAVGLQVLAHALVAAHAGLGAAVVGIAVQVDVAARRGPRLVRLVGVDHQRERPAPPPWSMHGRRGDGHPRRPRASTRPPSSCRRRRGSREPDARCAARAAPARASARARAFETARGRRVRPTWPSIRHEAVEARAKRRVAGEAQKGVVGHVAGPPAGAPQRAREGGVHVGDAGPARRVHEVALGSPVPEREDPPPGEDRAAGGHGGHRLGMAAREAQPLRGRARRCSASRSAAVGADVVGAQRVDDDHQHVRPVGSLREAARIDRCRHRTGPGELEEVAPRQPHGAILRPRRGGVQSPCVYASAMRGPA